MTPAVARPAVLPALTGVRALAAAWVLLEHFRFELFGLFPGSAGLTPWVASGYLGVEVFFVLSGFVLSHNYADRFVATGLTRTGLREYLVNRFARIYPVHLVTLLGVLGLVLAAAVAGVSLLTSSTYTPVSFVGNVLLLQAWPGVPAWNKPAWSISTEFAAYLVFPLLALAIARIRSARVAFGVALVGAVLGVAAMLSLAGYAQRVSPVPVEWLRILTEFVVGCLLWRGWRLLGSPRNASWDLVAALGLLGTVVALPFVDDTLGGPLLTTPLIAVFVLGCAGATGPVARFLSHPVMQWGGRISYSVYMTHFVLLTVLEKLVPWDRVALAALPVRVTVLAGLYSSCVLIGWLTYLLVEEPGRRVVRRRLAPRRTPVAVDA